MRPRHRTPIFDHAVGDADRRFAVDVGDDTTIFLYARDTEQAEERALVRHATVHAVRELPS